MKKIILVQQLNSLNILFVMVYKFLNFEIYVYEFSKTITNWRLIKFLQLEKCNFEDCSDINLSLYGGNITNAVDQVTNKLLDNDILNNFEFFYTNVKDSNKKIRLTIQEFLLNRFIPLNNILIWTDGYFKGHNKDNLAIYLLCNISKAEKEFVKIQFTDLNVKPILSSNLLMIFILFTKFLMSVFKKILGIIFGAITIKSHKDKKLNSSFISKDIDTSVFPILYFPHKSIFYGDLFIKDNFYSEDIDSVFSPSNLLHIELGGISLSAKQSEYYKANKIKTVIFPNVGIKNICVYLTYIFGEIGLKKVLQLLRKDFVMFCVCLFTTVKFLSNKDLISKNYKAKLVLSGYDILFPIILSLAFESLKIKTIAVQERFLPTFFSHYPFILDTYLCNSELVCKSIKKSNTKFVNSCIPCGQIRTDILVNYQKNISTKNRRFTIVVFDFHSDPDFDNNRLNVLINWKENASFYKDICSLARELPEVDIIIRGKDCNWTKIPFFKDVVSNINATSNIWVDDDYSEFNKQYKLASMSDLVIARYSSIGDEIMALGKRVIYYDYFTNSSHYFASDYFNYNNLDVFAYSYIQLKRMTQAIINNDELLTEIDLLELQKMTNNAPADGNVKNRVIENLNIIYNQVC